MQPMKMVLSWLQENSNNERYMFLAADLKVLVPNLSDEALNTLLSRMVRRKYIARVCRSLYTYKADIYSGGVLLFHAAAYLRSNEFNYISLETALSDAGVISQVPINFISIMSSGRSNKISCGRFGSIEFVHTSRQPANLIKNLTYDKSRKLWCADLKLALKDMKQTRRNCDLINWELANELI